MLRTTVRVGLAVAVLGVVGCEGPSDPSNGSVPDGDGELGVWVQAQGRVRTYGLHEPTGWDRSTPLPLVIALHGATGSGREFRDRIGLDAYADARAMLAVYPDGVEGTWAVDCGGCFAAETAGVDDLAFLRTLVDHLVDRLPVDGGRVYLLGYSNGGMLAGHAACRGWTALVGIGSVSAPLARGTVPGCSPPSGLRVAHVHGSDDLLLPWEGREGSWPWLSVPETLELWAAAAGCDPEPAVELVRGQAGQAGAVERWDWSGCSAPGAVRGWRVEGGTHGWFERTGADLGLDATGAVLDYLRGIDDG